jgi:hypothetical protein
MMLTQFFLYFPSFCEEEFLFLTDIFKFKSFLSTVTQRHLSEHCRQKFQKKIPVCIKTKSRFTSHRKPKQHQHTQRAKGEEEEKRHTRASEQVSNYDSSSKYCDRISGKKTSSRHQL